MDKDFNTDQKDALRRLAEHKGLKKFLPYAEAAAEAARFREARALIWRTYRQALVGVGGAMIALITFWEKISEQLQKLLGGGG